MYNLSATNKLQDGGNHFATLLTITSSSSSNSIIRDIHQSLHTLNLAYAATAGPSWLPTGSDSDAFRGESGCPPAALLPCTQDRRCPPPSSSAPQASRAAPPPSRRRLTPYFPVFSRDSGHPTRVNTDFRVSSGSTSWQYVPGGDTKTDFLKAPFRFQFVAGRISRCAPLRSSSSSRPPPRRSTPRRPSPPRHQGVRPSRSCAAMPCA